jgi:GAF domain-containing protein/anti-sigma regulatory factor (Ser/Thr protein kinase)
MTSPVRKAQKAKSTARAGVRPARADPRAGKPSASDAAYKEAIEQQAATAEILRAISRSPADVQPIFQTIVDKAHALCGAVYSVLYRYDGALLHIVADKHVTPRASPVLRDAYPQKPRRDKLVGRVVLEKRAIHTKDITKDARFPASSKAWERRAAVVVPLLREGKVLGAISCGRFEAKPFTKNEIALLATFADQAVIAIENARLFSETKEALERQTATSEVLGVISSSPTDVQPVFDAIAKSAKQLLGGSSAVVTQRIGDELHLAGFTTTSTGGDKFLKRAFPARLSNGRGLLNVEAVTAGKPVLVSDFEADGSRPFAAMVARERGYRSAVAVPMMRKGLAIGTISVTRVRPGPFDERQIGLLKTFADQAVIAIENTRLFNETKEALEHQKASAEVLKIVASSVESTAPVFEAITAAGMRLMPGIRVALILVRDGELHYASHSGISDERRAEMGKFFPMRLDRNSVVGTAILDKHAVHVVDIAEESARYRASQRTSRVAGWRAMLAIPLLRDDVAIGTIGLTRPEPGPFTEQQIALAQTFADQAVIAIRNANFFREINERNAELNKSLEFQGATAEILGSLSSSVTDTQPVFDAIVRNVLRLFGTRYTAVFMLRGEMLELAALKGDPGFEKQFAAAFPQPVNPATLTGKVLGTGQLMQVAPIIDNPQSSPEAVRLAQVYDYNSMIIAPMIRDGLVVGAIATAHREPMRFDDKQVALLKAFANQAVIAIENARLFNETREALGRQTATAEILHVIGSSVTDTQPVFEAIVNNCSRLFAAGRVGLWMIAEQRLFCRASTGYLAEPMPIDRESGIGACVLEGSTIHLPDLDSAAGRYPRLRQLGLKYGYRSGLYAPLLRDGRPIGGISVLRREAGAFGDKDVALLGTFADQAVIAIENVRLFNETKEALERQTAVAQVLKTISQTTFDLQAVFDVVVENATKLCRGDFGYLFRREGELFRLIASSGGKPELVEYERTHPTAITRKTLIGRMALDRALVHIPDLFADPQYEWPANVEHGVHTVAAVPIFSGDEVVGAIGAARFNVAPFSAEELRLFETFADQAAIAIENVRLFNETKEALERQTATAEILKVISSSPTDTQPVFDAIAKNAARVLGGFSASVTRRIGDELHLVGFTTTSSSADEKLKSTFPVSLSGPDRPMLVAIRTKAPACVNDTEDPGVASKLREIASARGFRSFLTVPMLRDGEAIGTISVTRREAGVFTDHQIDLLKIFAAQAVIAIENARLFNETKQALERQTATSDILKVISSSPTDVQPVFEAIVQSGLRLFPEAGVAVVLRDGDQAKMAAIAGRNAERLKTRFPFPLTREYMHGVAILDRTLVDMPDAQAYKEGPLLPGIRNFLASGSRAQTIVPMIRGDVAIGAVSVTHEQPGQLTDEQLALFQTFADQAVIAIENVRLFNETKEALEHQTAISEVLEKISGSPTDVSPVLAAVAERAARLCEGEQATVLMLEEGDTLRPRFTYSTDKGPLPNPQTLVKLDRGYVTGRAALDGTAINVEDVEALTHTEYLAGRENQQKLGYRSFLAAPMMREGRAIGVIAVWRRFVRRFSDKHVALVKTFAHQAAIAIENVRLFNETKDALEQQTATADVLAVISKSSFDLRPVFQAIAEQAVRLCSADNASMYSRDGEVFRAVAHAGNLGPNFEKLLDLYARGRVISPSRATVTGRVLLEKRAVQIPDRTLDTEYEGPGTLEARAYLGVPVLREGEIIGIFLLRRLKPGAFEDKKVKLLETFAAQAVVAIENARLFNETREALERQTATAEVLKTISRSTFDLDTVLQALLDNAARLGGARQAVMLRPDADGNYLPSFAFNWEPAVLMRLRERPIRAGRDSTNGRVLLEKQPIHIPDVRSDPEYGRKDLVELVGYRSVLAVPMLRHGEAIGLISLTGVEPFTDKQMEIVTTFADQAVIAIENVRLFREIEEKSAQLEVANKHKSEFLANMSHELRTPLNAIIGFSEVLIEKMFGEVNEKQFDYLKDIHESGRHLLSLINDILDLSKIEAGRMELELSTFHLPSAISNAMTLIRERAQRHGIALGSELDPALGELQADERKVKQILLNLLSNAVKFTPDGGAVHVSAALVNGSVEMSVRDTGIGIAPEDQVAVFEEFRQVGGDSMRKAEGTGLGLTLTKKLVELHGGEIRLQSAPGKGSTFSFTLPLR